MPAGGQLASFIHTYFHYDESHGNIYDTFSDFLVTRDQDVYAKLPKFYSEFLDMYGIDEKFPEFLDVVYDLIQITPGAETVDVYHGANIMTLMCCSVFHLCKMHHMMNMHEDYEYETAEIYLKPFAKWMKKILKGPKLMVCDQRVPGFFTPNAYLTLMFFIARDMEFEKTPYCKFFDGIDQHREQMKFKIDVLDEIIKPLFEQHLIDIYNFDIDSLYVIENGAKHIEKNMIIKYTYYEEDEYGSIFKYSAQSYFGYDRNAVYSYVSRFAPGTMSDFIELLFLNHEVVFFLYDLDVHDRIVYNNKWQIILNYLWKFLENSYNIEYEFKQVLKYLITDDASCANSSIFINKDLNETILFPIIHNKKHSLHNAKYIKNLFKAIFNNNYEGYGNDARLMKLIINKNMLPVMNKEGDDILLALLKTHFEKDAMDIDDMPMKSVSISSPWFTGNNDVSFQSFSEPCGYNFYRDVIRGLLKYISRAINCQLFTKQQSKNYKRKLYSFKEDLAQINIDIDKYPLFVIVVDSPVTHKSKRSLYKKIDEHARVTDAYDTFHDKKLAQKLSKIYVRTVVSDKHIDDYDRISKIRRYLIRKYKKTIDYSGDYLTDQRNHRIVVERGKELEALYTYWSTRLNRGDLNVPYIIQYNKSPGVDMDGILKQFFDKIGQQLQDRYFVLLPDTTDAPKFIIDPGVTVDEANFVGQVLGLIVLYNANIDFNISHVLLGFLMFRENDITDEEIFLYFLLDLDNQSNKAYIEGCSTDPNDPENLSGIGCDIDYIVNKIIKPRYHIGTPAFQAFVRGFFINEKNKKLFYSTFSSISDKIRMYDIDKLLSVYTVSNSAYKKYIFGNLYLLDKNREIISRDLRNRQGYDVFKWLKDFFVVDTDASLMQLYDKFDDSLIDKAHLDKKKEFMSKKAFCSSLLVYWTGVRGILIDKEYNVVLDDSNSADIHSHTCTNMLVLPMGRYIKTKQDLYNAFLSIFVWDKKDVFDMV